MKHFLDTDTRYYFAAFISSASLEYRQMRITPAVPLLLPRDWWADGYLFVLLLFLSMGDDMYCGFHLKSKASISEYISRDSRQHESIISQTHYRVFRGISSSIVPHSFFDDVMRGWWWPLSRRLLRHGLHFFSFTGLLRLIFILRRRHYSFSMPLFSTYSKDYIVSAFVTSPLFLSFRFWFQLHSTLPFWLPLYFSFVFRVFSFLITATNIAASLYARCFDFSSFQARFQATSLAFSFLWFTLLWHYCW